MDTDDVQVKKSQQS